MNSHNAFIERVLRAADDRGYWLMGVGRAEGMRWYVELEEPGKARITYRLESDAAIGLDEAVERMPRIPEQAA